MNALAMVRNFGKRSEIGLRDCLVGHVHCVRDGWRVARKLVRGRISSRDARKRIVEIEHRGDAFRSQLIDALRRSLVVPIDREDVFRFSRSIDDVLDHLRDFIREYDLYGGRGGRRFLGVITNIGEGIDLLEEVVESLTASPRAMRARALKLKKNGVSQAVQVSLGKAFAAEFSTAMLVEVELLRRLDRVGNALSEGADVISDGAVKRS